MKVAVVFLVCVVALVFGGIPWEEEAKTDDGWVANHARFVNNTRDNGDSVRILFYGDSITAGWDSNGKPVFDEYYAPLNAYNYGMSADRTEHVLWRIRHGEVTDHLNNTEVFIIKIGTNNIYDNDVTSIALGIVFNVLELRERLPHAKVLLLGVLPRGDVETTNRISSLNDIIQRLENGNTIRFLDMKDHFYRDGVFFEELFSDRFLHLSEAGYRKWAEVMDPLLKEMLGIF